MHYLRTLFILFILMCAKVYSIEESSLILTTKDVENINSYLSYTNISYLNDEKDIPIDCSLKETEAVEITWNKSGILKVVANKGSLQFPETGSLYWMTPCVLEIQAAGDIIFPEKFTIKYDGTGGGLILKSYKQPGSNTLDGNMKEKRFFKGINPQVDFSKSSEAAISLYYNPVAQESHKYQNPITEFSKHILAGSNLYIRSFMFINNTDDLKCMSENPTQHYALSTPLRVNTGSTRGWHEPSKRWYDNKEGRISGTFTGILNYNGFSLSSIKYTGRGTTEEEIFETALPLEGVWGSPLIFMSPPLHGVYKRLLNLIIMGDEQTAFKLIGHSEAPSLNGAGLAYITGENRYTPLHLAAMYGRTKVVDVICKNVVQLLGMFAFNLIGRTDKDGLTAFDLAARCGHFQIVDYFIRLYDSHKRTIYPQGAIKSIHDQKEKSQDNYKAIQLALESLTEIPENFPSTLPQWTGFPKKSLGDKREYKRMQLAHDRFFLGHLLFQYQQGGQNSPFYNLDFRPLETNLTKKLFKIFCGEYFNKTSSILKVDNLPSRSRVLLFCNVSALKLSMLPAGWGVSSVSTKEFLEQSHGQEHEKFIQSYNDTNGYWSIIREADNEDKFIYYSKSDKVPTTYEYGGVNHTVTNRSSKDKPGFAILNTIGQYESEGIKLNEDKNIRLKIRNISEKMPTSSRVAELMRQSRSSGRSITAQQLLNSGYQGAKEAALVDANFLNSLTLLLDLEVSSRLVREKKRPISEFDGLPIGIAWSQTHSLIINNDQSYQNWECFDKNANCHLFSGEGFGIRKANIQTVSRNFLEKEINDERLEKCVVEWKRRHPFGVIIASRETLHQELLDEYGGGYESDGELYKEDGQSDDEHS